MTTRSGLCGQIGFGVAGHDLDLFGRQESGHGRIDIVIRAGDGEALVAHGRRDRGHGRAADAGEMNRFDFREHLGRIMANYPRKKAGNEAVS